MMTKHKRTFMIWHRNCILLVLLWINWIKSAVISPEKELQEHIYKNYHKKIRPVLNKARSVNVYFDLEVVQIIEVKWKNELLQWNPQKWDNITSVRIDPETVWVPDILLHNNADENISGGTDKYKTEIQLFSDGSCKWNAPAVFTITCKIDVRYFPFDTQTCHMLFSSWTYDSAGITMVPSNNSVITKAYTNSSQWKIKSSWKYAYFVSYPSSSEPFSELKVFLTIERKPLYYLFNVITPCLVLITTLFIGFYLPPDCGERVSLTITVLLAVAVFLQLVTDHLPTNSDSIPILAVFYIVVMTESAVSLVTTCIILIIHYKSREVKTQDIPAWIRKIFLEKVAYCFSMKPEHTMGTSLITEENKKRSSSFQTMDANFDHVPNGIVNAHNVNPSKLSDILHEVKLIKQFTLHNKPTSEAEELQEEWKFLAKVLDRFFFWVFFVTVMLTTLCILVPTYLLNS